MTIKQLDDNSLILCKDDTDGHKMTAKAISANFEVLRDKINELVHAHNSRIGMEEAGRLSMEDIKKQFESTSWLGDKND